MPEPGDDSLRLSEVWHLGLALPRVGEDGGPVMGRGAGSSTEFQDHRNYTPGDDVRKLDWRAYARTDQLMLKRFREEVRPQVELIVDASLSMDSEPGKAQRAVDLAAMLARSSQRMGWRVRVWRVGEQVLPLPVPALLAQGLSPDARRPLMDSLRHLAPRVGVGSMVVLVSDFLSPLDPAALVALLGQRAGALGLLQVLGEWESDPPVGGSVEMVDSELGERMQVTLEPGVVARYRERLERLSEALDQECRRAGGAFSAVVANQGLEQSCLQLGERGWLVTG